MDAPAAIHLVRSTSLSSLVEAAVTRMILAGELEAGAQIKEAAIASSLGVGRSSVREALRTLAEAGLVRIEKNRGAFVRRIDDAEAREMYVVREGLEAMAGDILARRITDAEITELRGRVDQLDGLAEMAAFDRYFPLNLTFHDRVFEMAGNATLTAIYRRLTNELHTLRRRGLLQGGGLAVSNTEHRAIVEALAARDPRAASAALATHVRNGGRRFQGLDVTTAVAAA
jgi:DNA-binding GntR family transcriptional regulator